MKFTAIFTIIAIISGISSSLFLFPSQTENKQIGNVVYSVLGPQDFKEENGSGWVLLDGKTYQNSILSKQYGIATIPNGNGAFIRVLDTERDPQKRRDIDRQFGAAPGQFQKDAIKLPDLITEKDGKHRHDLGYAVPSNNSPGPNDDKRDVPKGGDSKWLSSVHQKFSDHEHKIKGFGMETRPQNIILYTYIKIN